MQPHIHIVQRASKEISSRARPVRRLQVFFADVRRLEVHHCGGVYKYANLRSSTCDGRGGYSFEIIHFSEPDFSNRLAFIVAMFFFAPFTWFSGVNSNQYRTRRTLF